jgi:hypothetical protein
MMMMMMMTMVVMVVMVAMRMTTTMMIRGVDVPLRVVGRRHVTITVNVPK